MEVSYLDAVGSVDVRIFQLPINLSVFVSHRVSFHVFVATNHFKSNAFFLALPRLS